MMTNISSAKMHECNYYCQDGLHAVPVLIDPEMTFAEAKVKVFFHSNCTVELIEIRDVREADFKQHFLDNPSNWQYAGHGELILDDKQPKLFIMRGIA